MSKLLQDTCESLDSVPLGSERFKVCWSLIQASSSFTIEESLSRDRWDRLMKILGEVDVSQIRHLKLVLSDEQLLVPSGIWTAVKEWRGQALTGVAELSAVLGSGRFSELKTLDIKTAGSDVKLGEGESESLAAALRTGKFQNLRVLGLPACDAGVMLHALVEGQISQLSEFLITSGESDLRESKRRYPKERLQLYTVFKSGYFNGLQALALRSGVIYGFNEETVRTEYAGGWDALSQAIRSKQLLNLKSLDLSYSPLEAVDLRALIPLLSSSLEKLCLAGCGIGSQEFQFMMKALMERTVRGNTLALKCLDLNDNNLGNDGVRSLVRLVAIRSLLRLEELNLAHNGMDDYWVDDIACVRLGTSIGKGDLPKLQTLTWIGNMFTNVEAGAISGAYLYNKSFTGEFIADWKKVRDVALRTQVEQLRDRNIRLTTLKKKHEELEEVLPLTCAKVFICGYPEVGKTKLRKTLCKSVTIATKFKWERRPNVFKEPRTRGIELSRIEEKGEDGQMATLLLWDLAGQEEFHVLHGTFFADLGFAGGKATTFVLVFRAPFENDTTEGKLLYWLRFVASSSLKGVKRHVVIVLNCFENVACLSIDKILWMALIRKFEKMFEHLIYLRPDPVIIDARVAASVQELKSYLFGHTRQMLMDVEVPTASFKLQEDLREWSKGESKGHLPILTWQAFEKGLQIQYGPRDGKALKAAASYLHEIGELIYFDEAEESEGSGSNNRCIVVPDPEWFCRKVVGQLLLPKEMLDGGGSVKVSPDGSISKFLFQSFFEHLLVQDIRSDDVISLLERVGLCYRKGEEDIIIPALICADDGRQLDWEGKGYHGVMGRSLATEDMERSAIPVTLFRRLQVELAQDRNLGGRGDSGYIAGKSFSNFKVGQLLVFVQFDVDHSDPRNDRIDILVKSLVGGDFKDVSLAQMKCICEIQQKLQVLCVACCPGLKYDIKAIKPWNARAKAHKMTERELMSVKEIKDLLTLGQKYSSWQLNEYQIELKTLFPDKELKDVVVMEPEVIGLREYDECGRNAVKLGLLDEESLQRFKECEGSTRNRPLAGVMENSTLEDENSDNDEGMASNVNPFWLNVIWSSLGLNKIYDKMHELTMVVGRESRRTRCHIDERHEEFMSEIRHRHGDLIKLILAQQAFSIQEKESSVPRYLFLAQKKGESHVWISLKEALSSTFQLHLLCEAHFDDGLLHEVKGQEGITLKKNNEWIQKISPWLKISLQVALMVAQLGCQVYLPGLANLIPNYTPNNAEPSAKAVDTAAKVLLEEAQKMNQSQGCPPDYNAAEPSIDLKERLIAQEVVKDLINELGHAEFAKNIGLRKVVLRPTIKLQTSRPQQYQQSVCWICKDCCDQYGDRITDIT